jgi:hypothetical protein
MLALDLAVLDKLASLLWCKKLFVLAFSSTEDLSNRVLCRSLVVLLARCTIVSKDQGLK